MHMPTNIVTHNVNAVRASIAIVDRVQAADLGRPTPCSDWNLAELLMHMIAQHRGFAASAAGDGADLAVWQSRPLDLDPVAEYRKTAEEVLAAFAEDGVLERQFAIPEVVKDAAFPAEIAITMHTVDYLVHAWDVARAVDVEFDADLAAVRATAPLVAMVPDGPERLEPGSAFRPSVKAGPNAGEFDTMLAALGRDPNWSR
jgi:uncharacterized protein (TIGR03086 family)